MRPTDSTRILPRWLLVLLVVLLAGRVGFGLWERAHPLPKAAAPSGGASGHASGSPGSKIDRIAWSDFAHALPLAQASQRPVLYEYSAEWCGPCRRLSDEVFADANSAYEINAAFVPVHFVDRRQEDGRNPAVVDSMQKAYVIEAFPTLVATTADGRELGRIVGYPGKQEVRDSLRAFADRAGGMSAGTIRMGM